MNDPAPDRICLSWERVRKALERFGVCKTSEQIDRMDATAEGLWLTLKEASSPEWLPGSWAGYQPFDP